MTGAVTPVRSALLVDEHASGCSRSIREPAASQVGDVIFSRAALASRARSLRGGARCEETRAARARCPVCVSMTVFKILQRVAAARKPNLQAQPPPVIEFLVPHCLDDKVGKGGTLLVQWGSGWLQLC